MNTKREWKIECDEEMMSDEIWTADDSELNENVSWNATNSCWNATNSCWNATNSCWNAT